MAKGIIKITPKSGANGKLQVTQTSGEAFNVAVGDILNFPDPGITVRIGDEVTCNITSSTTCSVTGPASTL